MKHACKHNCKLSMLILIVLWNVGKCKSNSILSMTSSSFVRGVSFIHPHRHFNDREQTIDDERKSKTDQITMMKKIKSKYLQPYCSESSYYIQSRIGMKSSSEEEEFKLKINQTETETETETETDSKEEEEEEAAQRKRDKVMSFLRKVGRVGGNKDFTTAMGVDEGPSGKSGGNIVSEGGGKKTPNAYRSCTQPIAVIDYIEKDEKNDGLVNDNVNRMIPKASYYGIIDDLSESFPYTSCGTEWAGFTDKVMGGVSMGRLTREEVPGTKSIGKNESSSSSTSQLETRMANVMRGRVSLYNNGGFVQMAAPLSNNPALSLTVDASFFDGIELDVLYRGQEDTESFNIHLRNLACVRQFSSYRNTFEVKNDQWMTVRVPFKSFVGYGPGSDVTPFEATELRRIGVVAIGKAMDVFLAISGLRFYKL